MIGGRKNGQGSVLDAAQALNTFLKSLQFGGVAANENRFDTMMVVQMIML